MNLFFDALVAMKFLNRDGDGAAAKYANTEECRVFLVESSPRYIGGILTMLNARLFRFWNDLPEALLTGQPQNETKGGGRNIFEELYADSGKLEQFLGGMTGLPSSNTALTSQQNPTSSNVLRSLRSLHVLQTVSMLPSVLQQEEFSQYYFFILYQDLGF